MSRQIIPAAIAREPWHVLVPLFALNTFGSVVLYSAASNVEGQALFKRLGYRPTMVEMTLDLK